MKREESTLAGLLLFLTMAPLVFSQASAARPCPDVRPESVGCELVEWSHLQEPVPLPEPDAKPVPPDHQTDPLPSHSESSPAQPRALRQIISGMIVRDSRNYVLQAENATYQLDDQSKARQHQGQKVKIVGRLDADANVFHVESIEPLS